MKIEKITVTARTSLNYQVSEVSVEASELSSPDDISSLEKMVIQESVKMVKIESEKVGVQTNEKPVTEVTKKYPAKQYHNKEPRMASPAQIGFLQKLGYTGEISNLTSQQASQLIEQLKAGGY